MWKVFNPNPKGKQVGDCTVRAIAKAFNETWQDAYMDLCLYGFIYADMPTSNNVWGQYLKDRGYKRHFVDDGCTVEEFASKHPNGKYILALNGHIITVCDGDYFDSWNSGKEIPIYYWEEKQ